MNVWEGGSISTVEALLSEEFFVLPPVDDQPSRRLFSTQLLIFFPDKIMKENRVGSCVDSRLSLFLVFF